MSSACRQCVDIRQFERKLLTDIFARSPGNSWYVALNPKRSPFQGRVYIVLKRHLYGEDALHGLGALTDNEVVDFRDVYKLVIDALMKEFKGIKRIQNFMKIDRGALAHPDLDFMPVYEEQPYGDDTLLISHSQSGNIPLERHMDLKKRLAGHFHYSKRDSDGKSDDAE